MIIFLAATVYKKEAVEYQLTRNNRIIRPWGANDVDNSFIWLRDLGPGKYALEIRYRKQRFNTKVYMFEIEKKGWSYGQKHLNL